MNCFLKIGVLLFTVLPLSIAIAHEDITGVWQGILTIDSDRRMMVQFIITQAPYGTYTAVLNRPLEGNVNNITADKVDYFGGNLKIDVMQLRGSYDGDVRNGEIEGEWKQERTSFPLILRRPALSDEEMEMLLGEWHGKPVPEIPEGFPDKAAHDTPTYLFRFEMSEQGEFKGFYTIPDSGLSDEPLTDIGIRDGRVSFIISGFRQFVGKLTNGKMAGRLNNIDGPIFSVKSLTLVKGGYQAPIYHLEIPKEVQDQLSGAWNGTLTMKLPMVVEFHFETSKNGEFSGYMDTPEEKGGRYPVSDAHMSNGKLVLCVKGLGWRFKGEISPDTFVVDWTNTVSGTPIIFTRGEYVAPEYSLTLPEETMARLEGKWSGKYGGFDSTFRFERVEGGDFKGFANIPVIGPNEISFSDASLSHGKLTLKLTNVLPAEFTGELSVDKLVGELRMPWGDATPFSLVKENRVGKRQVPPWEKTANEGQGRRRTSNIK